MWLEASAPHLSPLYLTFHSRSDDTFKMSTILSEKINPVTEVASSSGSDVGRDENVQTEVLRGSVAIEAALRENPPHPWTARMIQLYCYCIVAFLCSALNGE